MADCGRISSNSGYLGDGLRGGPNGTERSMGLSSNIDKLALPSIAFNSVSLGSPVSNISFIVSILLVLYTGPVTSEICTCDMKESLILINLFVSFTKGNFSLTNLLITPYSFLIFAITSSYLRTVSS